MSEQDNKSLKEEQPSNSSKKVVVAGIGSEPLGVELREKGIDPIEKEESQAMQQNMGTSKTLKQKLIDAIQAGIVMELNINAGDGRSFIITLPKEEEALAYVGQYDDNLKWEGLVVQEFRPRGCHIEDIKQELKLLQESKNPKHRLCISHLKALLKYKQE